MSKRIKIFIICTATSGLLLIFSYYLTISRETTEPISAIQTETRTFTETDKTNISSAPVAFEKSSGETAEQKNSAQKIKTFLEINDVRYEAEIAEETSVYGLMSLLKNDGKINFTETTYIGMGKLITGINGMKSGGERTWIYYVNGTQAQVGVSNYILKPGDIVTWQYEEVR